VCDTARFFRHDHVDLESRGDLDNALDIALFQLADDVLRFGGTDLLIGISGDLFE
jgi:hypothetical protein